MSILVSQRGELRPPRQKGKTDKATVMSGHQQEQIPHCQVHEQRGDSHSPDLLPANQACPGHEEHMESGHRAKCASVRAIKVLHMRLLQEASQADALFLVSSS